MKTTKLLIISFASLLLMSCGSDSKDTSKSVNGQGSRGGTNVTPTQKPAINGASVDGVFWGEITADDFFSARPDTALDFNRHVKSFLSPQLTASDIGEVDIAIDNQAGVNFWGRGVQLKNGPLDFNRELPQGLDIFNTDTAELNISVFQRSRTSGAIEQVQVHFNNGASPNSGSLVASEISGNAIQLVFADSFGKVNLVGFLVQEQGTNTIYYEGQISFINLKGVDGAGNSIDVNHQAEVLGKFSIEACSFLSCVNR